MCYAFAHFRVRMHCLKRFAGVFGFGKLDEREALHGPLLVVEAGDADVVDLAKLLEDSLDSAVVNVLGYGLLHRGPDPFGWETRSICGFSVGQAPRTTNTVQAWASSLIATGLMRRTRSPSSDTSSSFDERRAATISSVTWVRARTRLKPATTATST
eukprot:m.225966 g.225966  ORF g.225966 m.225966 type:complete len:157 (-) comp10838_c0_seq3:1321-1791(-)